MHSKILALDFETYYDKDYSLKKMSTEAYVRGEQFYVHCCGFVEVHDGEIVKTFSSHNQGEIQRQLKHYADEEYAFAAHNAAFDGLICSHVYDVEPIYWYDTLSMARNVRGPSAGNSLANLIKVYGLEEKTVPYNLFIGKHTHELLTTGIMSTLENGALNDAKQCMRLLYILSPQVTHKELDLIDLTIRMFTEPTIEVDIPLLQQYHEDELKRRQDILNKVGVDDKVLGSDIKFHALLLMYMDKDEIEYKTTNAGNVKPALAKSDPFMDKLLHHEDEVISTLAQARVTVKSNIKTTRAQTFIETGMRGAFPMALTYFGTEPGRWASWDKTNVLNMPRGSAIRRALKAPDGYEVYAIDLSQIQLRLALAFAGMYEEVEAIDAGHDMYCETASAFYGYEVTKDKHRAERGLGKLIELSCEFGSGWKKVQHTAQLGTYGPKVYLSDDEAQRAVAIYREKKAPIVGKWNECRPVIRDLANKVPIVRTIVHEGITVDCARQKVNMFGKFNMHYDGLFWDDIEEQYKIPRNMAQVEAMRGKLSPMEFDEWMSVSGRKIYHSMFWQRIVQAGERCIIGDIAWRFSKYGYIIPLIVHDEVVLLVRHGDTQIDDIIQKCIPRYVSYIPRMPIAYEISKGNAYAK